MQLLLLLVATYVILVYTRRHVSLPGRLGMVIGLVVGWALGSYILAIGAPVGIRFWPLPILFAVVFSLFAGARLHQLYRNNFGRNERQVPRPKDRGAGPQPR